jgi:hypothetical protein
MGQREESTLRQVQRTRLSITHGSMLVFGLAGISLGLLVQWFMSRHWPGHDVVTFALVGIANTINVIVLGVQARRLHRDRLRLQEDWKVMKAGVRENLEEMYRDPAEVNRVIQQIEDSIK